MSYIVLYCWFNVVFAFLNKWSDIKFVGHYFFTSICQVFERSNKIYDLLRGVLKDFSY